MTIFEVARYIPLGSDVTAVMRNRTEHRGVMTAMYYGDKEFGHAIVLLRRTGELILPVADISYFRIEAQPKDYDIGPSGIPIDQAAWRMLGTVREYMKYMTPSKRQELDLTFQKDFPDETARMCSALDRAGLEKASELIGNWRKIGFDQWQTLFKRMYEARISAERSGDPDAPWLRRAEAYICCRARKENNYIYDIEACDPIAYAIKLLVRNLVHDQVTIRDEADFGNGPVDRMAAMDWLLLALCYHRSGMHASCAYTALIQSVLNLGSLFSSEKNRQTLIHLCANAHDFTFLRYVLERGRAVDAGQTLQELKAVGKCVCYMTYQMGGSGILDAADLLASVEGGTEQSLPQLRERLLAYVYKYIPRNRNDRYMAIKDAMDILLKALPKLLQEPEQEDKFGCLYEFHGGKDLPNGYYDGYILGQDFLSYRISYPADTYHRLPLQIQAMSARARETGERAVFGVRFYPSPAGMLYRYQADSEIEFEDGGLF